MLKNLDLTLEFVRRNIARSQLRRDATEYIKSQPQLATFAFDYIGNEIAVDGQYDKAVLDFLLEQLGQTMKKGTVLDVGANIGNHACAFARKSHRVIAFEPHPRTRQLLEFNVERIPNIDVMPFGASDTDAALWAVTPMTNYGATRIVANKPEVIENEDIYRFEVRKLDSIDSLRSEPVTVIKFDIEGHEAAAIRGAEQLIKERMPVIVIEVNPNEISNETSESVELLRSFGYDHAASVEVSRNWRTPQWLPAPLRNFLRLVEALSFGPPQETARFEERNQLESTGHGALVMSVEPIEALTPSTRKN